MHFCFILFLLCFSLATICAAYFARSAIPTRTISRNDLKHFKVHMPKILSITRLNQKWQPIFIRSADIELDFSQPMATYLNGTLCENGHIAPTSHEQLIRRASIIFNWIVINDIDSFPCEMCHLNPIKFYRQHLSVHVACHMAHRSSDHPIIRSCQMEFMIAEIGDQIRLELNFQTGKHWWMAEPNFSCCYKTWTEANIKKYQ